MRIEFTYARPREYFREQMASTARLAAMPSLAGAVLLAIAGVAWTVSALLMPGVSDELALAGVALVLIAAGLCIRARDRWEAEVVVPASWCSPREWLITDEALEATTPIGRTSWSWAAIRYAVKIPDAYFFRAEAGGQSFDVPREPLTPEQEQLLVDFITERGLVLDEPIRLGR